MELLTETATERELTQYEIERNKPTLSLNHSLVQSNLVFELKTLLRKHSTALSEIDLVMPEVAD